MVFIDSTISRVFIVSTICKLYFLGFRLVHVSLRRWHLFSVPSQRCQSNWAKFQQYVLNTFDCLSIINLALILGKGKTKSILLVTEKRLKKKSNHNIGYHKIYIEQYHTVTYLVCVLDENCAFSGH